MRVIGVMAVALVALAGLWGCSEPAADNELVVYTSRNDHLIKPVFDAYTEETGITIRYITDNASALAARIKAEGERTPADLLITVDAGNLWNAAEMELLQPVESVVLESNVPASYTDPAKQWFGLTKRARTIVYSTERVNPENLSSYEALAEPEWKGRLCLRTSKKVYNQSLVATMIERLGSEKAEAVVTGWVGNLATDVFSNDTALMEAIVAGQCDVGIVNTYYYGRMKRDNPQLPLSLFWANQQDSGVHINISGGAVTRYAPHPEQAKALLEWMTQPKAQHLLAEINLEYPVSPSVQPAEEVKSWGEFREDDLNVSVAGALQVDAVKLMDRAGYR
ncbi:Fe(3+) ABC transporter substrate-binding protein [Alcanivorax sp. DP30]|uniref:Fe(3+) ABC transporter substrate-binding protein n=1 Tax=Alcanivorax sp. DP30 TaxID=2606217 RepID=UPI00136EA761|nr:Fe(3+) ABC transporter substrate-binding protein [Alcanivorax sp. DP30]MZR63342.1 extracellular solute-binding protein [Alcanivorax sp. DP30]